MCRMIRCCAFLVFIWVAALQLTSSNTIDKAYSGDSIGEAQDFRDAGDVTNQLSDKRLQRRRQRWQRKLQWFIKRNRLEQRCKVEAKKETEQLQKKREAKDKTILRNNYQILQHGEGSFASKKEWLSAMDSEKCAGCLLKIICSHPPSFLSKYVSFSSWKSLKLWLFDVKLLLLKNLYYFYFQNEAIMP